MKKKPTVKENLIAKIVLFFAKSKVKSFDLNYLGYEFTLDEGGLFDTEVEKIDAEGIELDGYSPRTYNQVDVADLRYIVKSVLPLLKKEEPKVYKQQVIDETIEVIKEDIFNGDVEALDELLKFLPLKNLIAYLPEPPKMEIAMAKNGSWKEAIKEINKVKRKK